MFPEAFIELTLALSDVLKVTLFTFYQVYEVFRVARYGVGDFSSFVSCKKKYSLFDPLVEKNGGRGFDSHRRGQKIFSLPRVVP